MNVKTNKTKKQANVENQAVNLLSKEELCKRIEGVEKELKSYTWRELETILAELFVPFNSMSILETADCSSSVISFSVTNSFALSASSI